MKEQKTTKWSNFNPLCLARHVLRNLWMTVLAGLICVMAVYLLQTLVSKPSYDSQVTFAVTSRSASATASGSIAVTAVSYTHLRSVSPSLHCVVLHMDTQGTFFFIMVDLLQLQFPDRLIPKHDCKQSA